MSEQRIFSVEGMTCDHCARSLETALQAVSGVTGATVSYEQRRATVEVGQTVTDATLLEAVTAAGYRARGVEISPGRSPADVSDDVPATEYDLAVIGSGSAAFAAALKASESGARVAMVERGTIGGTCVNVGCVPSKTLIRAAESLHRAQQTPFAGLVLRGELADFAAVAAQRDELVGQLRQAKYVDIIQGTDGVDFIAGEAVFAGPHRLRVGDRTITANKVIIATGARPTVPDIPGLADSGYLTSTSILELSELPPELLVLGGRYIALELAQAFARLGSKVTVLQRSDHILPTEDDDLTEALADYLRDENIEVVTGVETRAIGRDGATYLIETTVNGKERTFTGSHLLAATGRRPNTDRLGLESIGVATTENGAVKVDDRLQTTVPGIYAAGDVAGEPAFVYTAAYEGALAAGNALGAETRTRDYSALPWVVFTDPQVAAVGMNEKAARAAGIEIDVAKLPLTYLPRALAARDTRGFIKLIKEKGGDRLLGACILAPEAGDIIMEPALAIRHGIGVSDLVAAFHPYLTQAEGIRLAAQTFNKDVGKLSCCA